MSTKDFNMTSRRKKIDIPIRSFSENLIHTKTIGYDTYRNSKTVLTTPPVLFLDGCNFIGRLGV